MVSEDDDDDDECPVCFQKMILPTAVPGCGHKFCFLCIKGAAIREGETTCPTCRGDVSPSIFKMPVNRGAALDMHDPESPSVTLKLSRPTSSGGTVYYFWGGAPPLEPLSIPLSLASHRYNRHLKRINPAACNVEPPSKKSVAQINSSESPGEGASGIQKGLGDDVEGKSDSELPQEEPERFYWLYKGRGGWWRFDPRLEKDIEAGRAVTLDSTDLIICGYAYVLDFIKMVQYRKETPTRTREIKFVKVILFSKNVVFSLR
ncbi:hypothetical protein Y032_0191g1327 [Ancylostoma ceylanicum]|uniref:E3 ubiquitin-protein ligase n=1 Tax=Ancylostoma ceylanicum TaxID=53326 RepID=A0A016SQN5_9BILA|nr:hypothetical protein Y032_0191g1327 [Ancylostoma ceylanicum]